MSEGRRRLLAGLVLLVLATLASLWLGGVVLAADKNIVLKKYPDLKIGFSTVNFSAALAVNVENTKQLIDFAAAEGFCWIELRDSGAGLKPDECQEIAAYAKSKKIEVAYALQVGYLDKNFSEVFSRGLGNVKYFRSGPKTMRTLIGLSEFAADPKKTGWDLKELCRMTFTANRSANALKAAGVTLVSENAFEPIKGDGEIRFGTTEFFANTNPNLGWQFDTANFFVTSRLPAKPEEALAFLEKFVGRLGYIHLKTASKENKPTAVLADSLLDFGPIFEVLAKNKKPYVAFELVGSKSLDECKANHVKSVEYLLSKY